MKYINSNDPWKKYPAYTETFRYEWEQDQIRSLQDWKFLDVFGII